MRIITGIAILFSGLFIVGIIILLLIPANPQSMCTDDGGCWDYIRSRCEYKDQGFCERDEADCTRRNGKWQADKGYCVLP